MSLIKKLYFSPVKSLSFNRATHLFVRENIGILNDRVYAFTRIVDENTSIILQNNPKKRELKYFLNLKNSPFLNKYNFKLNDKELLVYLNNNLINRIFIDDKDSKKKFCQTFIKMENGIIKIPYLIYNKDLPFFDTMPHSSISLINLNSIKDLELKSSHRISYKRFRGNIYIENLKPWKEFEWLNKIIVINKCLFKVTNKIQRCAATNLVPNSDKNDINVPMNLKKIYNHINMGIYLTPLNDGSINEGDSLEVVKNN